MFYCIVIETKKHEYQYFRPIVGAMTERYLIYSVLVVRINLDHTFFIFRCSCTVNIGSRDDFLIFSLNRKRSGADAS